MGSMPTNRFSDPAGGLTADAYARLGGSEQAALGEIARRLRQGAEVVCVIRPRGMPNAQSEVIILNEVSPDFLNHLDHLAASARSQNALQATSLEVPRPRAPSSTSAGPNSTGPTYGSSNDWTRDAAGWRIQGRSETVAR